MLTGIFAPIDWSMDCPGNGGFQMAMGKYFKMIDDTDKKYPFDQRVIELFGLFQEHNNLMGKLIRLNDLPHIQKDLNQLIRLRIEINAWATNNLKQEGGN
jgi:hypothetical protein